MNERGPPKQPPWTITHGHAHTMGRHTTPTRTTSNPMSPRSTNMIFKPPYPARPRIGVETNKNQRADTCMPKHTCKRALIVMYTSSISRPHRQGICFPLHRTTNRVFRFKGALGIFIKINCTSSHPKLR